MYKKYNYLKKLNESEKEIEATFLAIKYHNQHSVSGIDEMTAKILGVDEEKLIEKQDINRSRSKFSYRIAWCRTYLKTNGLINNEKRGYWTLTEEGEQWESVFRNKEEKNFEKQNTKSFRLEQILVKKGKQVIFETDFFNNNFINNKCSYTMIIGKNGSGKSTLLRALTQIFLVMTKNEEHMALNNGDLDYDYYELKYNLNEEIYTVIIKKEKGKFQITYLNNFEKSDFKDIVYPDRMLAISNIVNDKYMFASNKRYRYLGSRGSSNGYFIGDFEKKAAEHLKNIIKNNKMAKLKKALKIIGYEDIYLSNSFQNLDKTNIGLVYLKNNNTFLELESLSSGEKHIVGLVLSIISESSNSCIILIDEPENSLHPNWQINLITQLDKIMKEIKVVCHFIIATHSPTLFSSLPDNNSSVLISESHISNKEKKYSHRFIEYSPYAWSVESILYQVFEMRTTRNYFVEQDLIIIIDYLKKTNNLNENVKNSYDRLSKIVLSEHDPLSELLKKVQNHIINIEGV